MLDAPTVTTITSGNWSLLYSTEDRVPELYDLATDPRQENDLIANHKEVAGELHQYLLKFMRDTRVPKYLQKPRLRLRI
jgi:hypothetical protein